MTILDLVNSLLIMSVILIISINSLGLISRFNEVLFSVLDSDTKFSSVEIDFNFARKTREEGFMGLGQNLKSYRDNPLHNLNNVNKEYLESLGELKKFNKDIINEK